MPRLLHHRNLKTKFSMETSDTRDYTGFFRKGQDEYIDLSEVLPHSNVRTEEGRELVLEWAKILNEKKRKQEVKKKYTTPEEYFKGDYRGEELAEEVINPVEKVFKEDGMKNCDDCCLKIYFHFEENEKEYWHRDCMNFSIECREWFDSKIKAKTSNAPIDPIKCPFCKC